MRKHIVACFMLGGLVAAIGCGGGSETPPAKTTAKTSGSGNREKTPPSSEGTDKAPKPAPSSSSPKAGGWGTLKGRFAFVGDAPTPSPLTITQDREYCGKHDIHDESLLVNKDNQGIANVVVYLYAKRGEQMPSAHESYAAGAAEQVVLDNNQCRFAPHVCLLQTSQTLIIKNSDEVGHNTNIAPSENTSFNQTIPVGGKMECKFESAERRPAPVSCNIHPWMKGWVMPMDTPYYALTNENGEFEIKNLPSGTWTFQVWHELGSGIDEVELAGGKAEWSKGRVELAIEADGTNDLGDIKVDASLFKP
ncbi:MAG: hypothetical protein KDB14_12280 [Planctomycetales bacterium]|nr:hypothetical protein [Planctomycetales bacterium]